MSLTMSELVRAVWKRDPPAVERLLADGVDPDDVDDSGLTALFHAVEAGNVSVAASLLKHSARVDIKDPSGNTPLDIAIFNEHAEMVKLLSEISYAADGHQA